MHEENICHTTKIPGIVDYSTSSELARVKKSCTAGNTLFHPAVTSNYDSAVTEQNDAFKAVLIAATHQNASPLMLMLIVAT